jgi:hypothetical protein
MCLIASDSLFSAGSGLDQNTQALRTLTVNLWDSVARVVDGYKPDPQDQSVLEVATVALRGQVEAIEFVDKNAAGAEPEHVSIGYEPLIRLVWRAGIQLEERDLIGDDPVRALATLADALEKIAQGDREVATRFVRLVERLSRLADQMASEMVEKVNI